MLVDIDIERRVNSDQEILWLTEGLEEIVEASNEHCLRTEVQKITVRKEITNLLKHTHQRIVFQKILHNVSYMIQK